MRQLILMRHAKAEADAESGDDFDRALSAAGREAAPRVAQALSDAGARPDVALVSEAVRTRETWELVRPFFPKTEARFLHSLYLCAAETLVTQAELTRARCVMLVAHNPGLHELASRLAHRNSQAEQLVRAKFPTAAAAMFERKSANASWKLTTYVTPKDGVIA